MAACALHRSQARPFSQGASKKRKKRRAFADNNDGSFCGERVTFGREPGTFRCLLTPPPPAFRSLSVRRELVVLYMYRRLRATGIRYADRGRSQVVGTCPRQLVLFTAQLKSTPHPTPTHPGPIHHSASLQLPYYMNIRSPPHTPPFPLHLWSTTNRP